MNITQNNSESNESGFNALLQKIIAHFVKFVILIALLTLIVWLILIGTESVEDKDTCKWCFPFIASISVLVGSCPCALGLAIPSVVVITLNLAMKNGILIKKNNVLNKINKIKAIIFDKTGTLFTKVDEISDFQFYEDCGFKEDDLW